MILIFLSGGLFLGWSLGANDAANVFGTAVGTKMLRFRTAAVVCSVFVILGAVIGGAGAAHTLGKLGSVNAIAGAFMVALAAAFTVFWMTRMNLPVSTSQAVVGGIVGWNFFTGSLTDWDAFTKIVLTWVASPVLAAVFAMVLYRALSAYFRIIRMHLLRQDYYTRLGLLLVGAFGSYSLGANNIANVMGVFLPVVPFQDLNLFGFLSISPTRQLFFIGGLAIAVGVFTYSRRVMETVGHDLFRLSPEAALVVVLAEALVLFIFASETLEGWLLALGLPTIPLVPVSSSQAVVGAIIGIGIIKGGHGIRFNILGSIAAGWVTTPLVAGVLTFVALFFLQNVFNQEVSRRTTYRLTPPVLQYLHAGGIDTTGLSAPKLQGRSFQNPIRLDALLKRSTRLAERDRRRVIAAAECDTLFINPAVIARSIDRHWFSAEQLSALRGLAGKTFYHKWELLQALEQASPAWRLRPDTNRNRLFNKDLQAKREFVGEVFRVARRRE